MDDGSQFQMGAVELVNARSPNVECIDHGMWSIIVEECSRWHPTESAIRRSPAAHLQGNVVPFHVGIAVQVRQMEVDCCSNRLVAKKRHDVVVLPCSVNRPGSRVEYRLVSSADT